MKIKIKRRDDVTFIPSKATDEGIFFTNNYAGSPNLKIDFPNGWVVSVVQNSIGWYSCMAWQRHNHSVKEYPGDSMDSSGEEAADFISKIARKKAV